jgi:hypothetical protein
MAPPSVTYRYIVVELESLNTLYVNESTITSELWNDIQQRHRLIPSTLLTVLDEPIVQRELINAYTLVSEIIPVIGDDCWDSYRFVYLNHAKIDHPLTWLLPQRRTSIRDTLT